MGSGRRRGPYDVVFYVPWIGSLLDSSGAPAAGGAETQIYLIGRALSKRGMRVCLVAFDTPSGLPSRVGDIDVVARTPYHGGRGWMGRIFEVLSTFRTLRRIDAKVVVTRAAGPNVGIVGLFARLWRRYFVYSSANVSDFAFDRLDDLRRNHFLYHLGLRLADLVVVQTDEQVEMCRSVTGRVPTVIGSIAEPTTLSRREPVAFLWVGRLVWYKHPQVFVELARRLPEARFRLVGVPLPGGEAVQAEVEMAAAGVPNLDLLQPRERSELLSLMSEAVAIVNTADFEGMPNIFLEGWARGVPALALTHDPDHVITRYQVGRFADGSFERFVTQAHDLWIAGKDDQALAKRCEDYVATHHSADAVGRQWERVVMDTPGRHIDERDADLQLRLIDSDAPKIT